MVRHERQMPAVEEGFQPIYVTRPSMPPLAELMPLLEEVWANRIVSNGGPMLQRFEAALVDYLGIPHLSVVANASLGLVLALHQAGVAGGEVITTPFSFVASAHAIRWAGAQPVFADIEPVRLGLCPQRVAEAITPRTKAILAVHCYGHACDVEGLAAIAKTHGIPLLLDGAHAFGTQYQGRSLLEHGDCTVVSFHGTKVFHTCEGGAVIHRSAAAKQHFDRLVNHGITNETAIEAIGLNSKASELHAALGLVQLRHVDAWIAAREQRDAHYRTQLADLPGLECLAHPNEQQHNYYNFPVRITTGSPLTRDQLFQKLRNQSILARRYFHPLLSELPMYRQHPSADPARLANATAAADQMLCLPLYHDLRQEDQDLVVDVVRRSLTTALR